MYIPFLFCAQPTESTAGYIVTTYLSKEKYDAWVASSTPSNETNPAAAQARGGALVTAHGFALGMRLEAVDRQHRSLTAPSKITAIDTSTSPPTLTVHFDGWGDAYNYAAAAGDPTLRYVGWCVATGRELQPPGPQVRGRLPRGARR